LQTTKIVNYVAGILALIHAGVSSKFMQQTLMLPNFPSSKFESADEIRVFVDSLPDSYITVVEFFILSGACLFIVGIVALVLNIRLDKQLPIRKLAIRTSVMTLLGVFASLMPLVNIVYPILLSIFYIH